MPVGTMPKYFTLKGNKPVGLVSNHGKPGGLPSGIMTMDSVSRVGMPKDCLRQNIVSEASMLQGTMPKCNSPKGTMPMDPESNVEMSEGCLRPDNVSIHPGTMPKYNLSVGIMPIERVSNFGMSEECLGQDIASDPRVHEGTMLSCIPPKGTMLMDTVSSVGSPLSACVRTLRARAACPRAPYPIPSC
jgi:hypothetical protein